MEKLSVDLEKKLSELEQAKNNLEGILSYIGQAILFIDQSGRMTTYNPSAEKLLGYGRDEVLYRPFQDFFDDQAFGFSVLEALKSKVSTHDYMSVFIDRLGKKKDLEITATYVPQNHSTEGLLLILKDVTELHRLENRAQHNDRMKEMGQMAAIMAHEIRNPLGGIKGFATLLSRDLQSQPKLKQMADYILEGVESLNSLVNQVLNYSKPLEPHFVSTHIKDLLKELLIHEKGNEALQPESRLEFDSPKEDIVAPVDQDLLKRAVLNLITNAIQAMPKGGNVKIRLSSEDDQAVIKIADTGEGITPENMKKIFTPYFTTKPHGTGYGLAEVQKVVQCHGGHIEVISKPGEGTEFTLKIPLKVSHDD